MQSSGGVMSLDTAIQTPVRMMESGPVAGVIGAARVAHALGYKQAIAFDMGGTTAKTSLTRGGDAEIAGHYYIGGYNTGQPVMLPVVDIVEVGSGGGSIAWVDTAGGLKVGPRSAGAVPGPACYGRGGTQPTVTDANLVLGRLGAQSFLGGEMILDRQKSTEAIRRHIAEPLEIDVEAAAAAVIRIANSHMALALRSVTIEKGQDPRDFAIVGFGGAGPLHVAELAHELSVPVVVVPRLPGQFSAWGMLACDLRSDIVQTLLRDFAAAEPDEIAGALQELTARVIAEVGKEPDLRTHAPRVNCGLDLRYRGQEFTITVPLPRRAFTAREREEAAGRFHELHRSLYGHAATDEAIELAALRVTVHRAVENPPSATGVSPGAGASRPPVVPYRRRRVYMGERFGFLETAVYKRDELPNGAVIDGPAVIEEPASTTLVLPEDRVCMVSTGELIIDIKRNGGLNQ
jgi:N-methylhydantoinase A